MTTENKSFPYLFHFSLQLICAAVCVYWLIYLPKSGKAVLLLGAMAAVMMLVDMRPVHKTVYILLVFGLVSIENRALDRERAESAKETVERLQKENEKFQGIADSLTDSIHQSQSQFARMMSGVTQNINAVTGGNSFCYVLASDTGNAFQLNVFAKGESPLHDITVDMVDLDKEKSATLPWTWDTIRGFTTSYPIIPSLASTSGRMLGQIPMATWDSRNLHFNFFSMNGVWYETLSLRRVNGTWIQAIQVKKEIGPNNRTKTIYEEVPPNFPKVNGRVDW